jgi:Flp pilus assembly protein TadD
MGVKLDEPSSSSAVPPARAERRLLHHSLGWVYFKRGDYPRAIEYLERAAELAGEDPTIVEHLGDAYHKTGKNDSALQSYRDALGTSKDATQIERLKAKIQGIGDGIRADGWPRS